MRFFIERLHLTDVDGTTVWNRGVRPEPVGEAEGTCAVSVLAAVLANNGAEQVGLTASFSGERTIAIARKDGATFALSARPVANLLPWRADVRR